MSMDYIGSLLTARRSLVVEVGGVRRELAGAERYDLMLRLSERARRITHLARVLYHHHGLPRAWWLDQGAKRALCDAAARRGWPAEVTMPHPGRFRVRYAISGRPRVAIVIPTRDKIDVLDACIRSIERLSTYPNYELVVVDNGSVEADSLRYLAELGQRHRVIADPRPFNWSALNNRAARETTAPILLFLNNDVEVIAPDWIEAMLEHAQRPEVGVVGAKLLYADGTVQHAGVIMGVCGTAVHAFRTFVADGSETFGFASLVRNYSAVTGACMMVRREVFEALEGFDEALSVAFNDVDFCLRACERGYAVVYTPYASLYHYESVTRGNLDPPENKALLISRWQARIADDPFYSPHLTRTHENIILDA
jgi:GT2 family glycosyltransferase